MYSVNFSKTGGPEVLKYEKLSISDPKENEVLIKHSAIGLNFIDTYHRSGLYPVPLPSGIGLEGAGIIEKVGPSVKNFKEGDKVAYAAAPLGSYSTHRIYPTKNLVKVPDGRGTGYNPDLWYVSMKFKPIAECFINTSFSLGSEIDNFSYFKTSGPPVFEKFTEYI